MQVPEYIKKSIRIAGKHNAISAKHKNIVRDWLLENGNCDDDGDLSDKIADFLVDSIELENDLSEDLIGFLEKYNG